MGPAASAPASRARDGKAMEAASLAAFVSVASIVLFAATVALGSALSTACFLDSALSSTPALNPLLWYDKLLRRAGPLLPLLPPLLRALSGSARPPLPATMAAYIGVALLRIAVYVSAQPGGALGPPRPAPGELPRHWMSDHILLGGSMAAALSAEASLAAASLPPRGAGCWRRAGALGAALALAALLWALTAADMFFTARHFHPALENARAWALSAVLFQGPLASWAIWHAGRPPRQPTAA